MTRVGIKLNSLKGGGELYFNVVEGEMDMT